MREGTEILKWKMSLAETLAFGVTVAALVLWAVDRFQTRVDASEVKVAFERKLELIETNQSDTQKSLSQMASDVSYIRGRLEPKGK